MRFRSFVWVIVAVNALFALETFVLPKVDDALKKQGKEIYDRDCYACHRWTRPFAGPAMSENIEKYREHPEALVAYLKNPTPQNPSKYPPMTIDPLTESEAKVLSAWLFFLIKNTSDPDRPK